MKKNLNILNIIAWTLIVGILIVVYFSLDTAFIKSIEFNKKINEYRSHKIQDIISKINFYKQSNKIYPRANTYSELLKFIWNYEDDYKYHYSYQSDGNFYILTYPESTINGVKCNKIFYPLSWALEKDVEGKNCKITLSKGEENFETFKKIIK